MMTESPTADTTDDDSLKLFLHRTYHLYIWFHFCSEIALYILCFPFLCEFEFNHQEYRNYQTAHLCTHTVFEAQINDERKTK